MKGSSSKIDVGFLNNSILSIENNPKNKIVLRCLPCEYDCLFHVQNVYDDLLRHENDHDGAHLIHKPNYTNMNNNSNT
jgi:hypothetical protein